MTNWGTEAAGIKKGRGKEAINTEGVFISMNPSGSEKEASAPKHEAAEHGSQNGGSPSRSPGSGRMASVP